MFGKDLSKTTLAIQESEEFKLIRAEYYDEFIEQCKNKFSQEKGIPNDLFTKYFVDENKLIDNLRNKDLTKRIREQQKKSENVIKAIKPTVNWSHYVLIDEAQDCANYEKELLLELFGSDRLIIASGGKDQLIRTAVETDWKKSFNTQLNTVTINLTHISHRQKGNIVEFINAFSKEFGLNTKLNIPDSIKGKGKVIIDLRGEKWPLDIIKHTNSYGKCYGCSSYESLMILLPNENYTCVRSINNTVTIDKNDTINFDEINKERCLSFSLPKGMKALDCTINRKSQVLKLAGHDKTRCLLYESCRGLEAWSVLCLEIDTFFKEKLNSKAASDYADEALCLFKSDKEKREIEFHRFASLWLLMAFTRAMDTLYISFRTPQSYFASKFVQISSLLPFVEIVR